MGKREREEGREKRIRNVTYTLYTRTFAVCRLHRGWVSSGSRARGGLMRVLYCTDMCDDGWVRIFFFSLRFVCVFLVGLFGVSCVDIRENRYVRGFTEPAQL